MFLLILLFLVLSAMPLLKDIADYKRQEARTKNLIRFLKWEDRTFRVHENEEYIYDPYSRASWPTRR